MIVFDTDIKVSSTMYRCISMMSSYSSCAAEALLLRSMRLASLRVQCTARLAQTSNRFKGSRGCRGLNVERLHLVHIHEDSGKVLRGRSRDRQREGPGGREVTGSRPRYSASRVSVQDVLAFSSGLKCFLKFCVISVFSLLIVFTCGVFEYIFLFDFPQGGGGRFS